MRSRDTLIPHIALPFQFIGNGPGGVNVNEQDSLDDVYDCVQAVIRCGRGFRPEQREFGTTNQSFIEGGDIDLSILQAEVSQWEERAENLYEQDPDRFDYLVDVVKVRVATIGGPQHA